jgi:predicted lipid-binding transport protein (Tim44 family)
MLYLMLGVLTYRAAGRLGAAADDGGDTAWAGRLGSMIQVSLVGYAVGGAFLGLAYFDLYYCLIAIVLCAQLALRQTQTIESGAEQRADAAARPAH